MSAYSTIRDYLGVFIGKRVIDITQHDEEEFDPKDPTTTYIEFLFEDGGRTRIFTQGNDIGPAFTVTHSDDCPCSLCEEEEA